MSGPRFFQTGMGQKFYEVTVPRVAAALERIATALEKQNEPITEVAPPTNANWTNIARDLSRGTTDPLMQKRIEDALGEAFEVGRRSR